MEYSTGNQPGCQNLGPFGGLAVSARDPRLCVPVSRPVCLFEKRVSVPTLHYKPRSENRGSQKIRSRPVVDSTALVAKIHHLLPPGQATDMKPAASTRDSGRQSG